MEINRLIEICFVCIIGSLMLFLAIGTIVSNNIQTDATKDFCNQKGMEYINSNYCADGENAIEIKVKHSGLGFKKSDYEFYIVATRR